MARGSRVYRRADRRRTCVWGCRRHRAGATPFAVAAYWFTASTSFANPAVTIARSLSDTFAGIAPVGVAGFIVMQLLGALCATFFFAWIYGTEKAVHPISLTPLGQESGRSPS